MEEMISCQSGFTLIEILIAVAVAAILAAIAIPTLVGIRNRAVYVRFQGNAHQIGAQNRIRIFQESAQMMP